MFKKQASSVSLVSVLWQYDPLRQLSYWDSCSRFGTAEPHNVGLSQSAKSPEMVKRRLENIPAWSSDRFSNGPAKEFHSIIDYIKSPPVASESQITIAPVLFASLGSLTCYPPTVEMELFMERFFMKMTSNIVLLSIWFLIVISCKSFANELVVTDKKNTSVVPIPINMAEAIIEPFYDESINGLSKWTITPGYDHGLKITQFWCWVSFEWAKKPESGPALSMQRRFNTNCDGYDKLLLSVTVPEGIIVRAKIDTDRGTKCFESLPSVSGKQEYAIDLGGAKTIQRITLEAEPVREGLIIGWFNWIGLQNSSLLSRYEAQWQRFESRWEGYLKDESYIPAFEPLYGIMIKKSELAGLREMHSKLLQEHGESYFTRSAKKAMEIVPEKQIGEFVNPGYDPFFVRNRDYDKIMLSKYFDPGSDTALAGLLLKDKELMRLAARYAMSIAMCDTWDYGFPTRLKDGLFESRAFVPSLASRQVAMILDLAGEMFTDVGKELILRRLAEQGTGFTNFTIWKHEEMFNINQISWFSPARLYTYLVLEKEWPRVKNYTDLAFSELHENIDNIMYPDGGFGEGPRYFAQVMRSTAQSLYYYSQARNEDFLSTAFPSLLPAAHYADVIMSTDINHDMIPIADGNPMFYEDDSISFLAALLPQSQWVAAYHKVMARQNNVPQGLIACKLRSNIPAKTSPAASFKSMPSIGLVASRRSLEDQPVKLLIIGNRAGMEHSHEDKGSFVLEFAGDTFAMDPGMCAYGTPLSMEYKYAQRHNMLVPKGTRERPAPENPLPKDIVVNASGDEVRFGANIDLAPGWETYYIKWNRTFKSDEPGELVIIDEYELAKGDDVDFYWQTLLPVEIKDNIVTIMGKRGNAKLSAPKDCEITIDKLELYGGGHQTRIAVSKKGRAGSLEINVSLERNVKN